MTLSISTANALESIGDSGINAPASASGYQVSDLYRRGLGRGWLSSAAGTVHEIDINAAGVVYDCLALFDVRGEEGVAVTSVSLKFGSVFPPVALTPIGTINLNSRGDGAWLASTGSHACLTLEINLASSARVYVGELWLGNQTELSRNYTTRTDELDYAVIENTSDVRSVQTSEIGDYITRINLDFDRMTDAERDEVTAVFRALRGSKNPCVMMPRGADHPTDIIYGRIQRRLSYGIDYPVNTGLGFQFVEDGRPYV